MQVTLKAARINRNLTQSEAAQALGISVSTLANYEQGRQFPDVPMIKKIEALYETTYDEIIFLPSEND